MADGSSGSSAQVTHLKVERSVPKVRESKDRNHKPLQQRDSGYFSPVTPGTTPGTTPESTIPKTIAPQAQRSSSSPSTVSDGMQKQQLQMSGKSGLKRTLSSPGALDGAARGEVSGMRRNGIAKRTAQLCSMRSC